MELEELAQKCRDQIAACGKGTVIVLTVPGKPGTKTAQLCQGGPRGEVVRDADAGPGKVVVNFKAAAVLAYLEKYFASLRRFYRESSMRWPRR